MTHSCQAATLSRRDLLVRQRHGQSKAPWPHYGRRQGLSLIVSVWNSFIMIPSDASVADALQAARIAAEGHMAAFEAAGDTWYEVPVTQIVLAGAFPVAKFATFTQNEEATTGSDWLWWWLDDSGEAFGMLVQAKRLLRKPNKWDVDFDFNKGAQRRALIETGRNLNVAPMYAIYEGTSEWRGGAFCRQKEHSNPCESCRRSTVSLVPAIVTDFAVEHDVQVSIAMDESLPLESIADPDVIIRQIWDSNIKDLEPDLAQFLFEPQVGARRVAQMVFEKVTKVRGGQFSGPTGTKVVRGTEPIFAKLPDDYGHFNRQYYPEILDGLRSEAPDYVLDVLADVEVPEAIRSRVAGIAVFSC